ncbi:hypothetical protein BMR08_00460 [Methylococcaceae bacterium CS2]|nr:hypothetical protein BMR10_05545 [Methylococcaceae bacterium CS4]TXL08715.1 hypothetical protein BMR09_02500 [Methylococcaceae bacterium CS3]TXL12285.1 hypothetical protein BMR08_00460 [Methylococcaceae bacterium CS2]
MPTKQRPYAFWGLPALAFALHGWQRKQLKTLVTRAGPGTKIICIGNLSQIDTPYLTATSSGLTYVVDKFKSWEHGAHITLRRGERSRLADHASEVL